MPLPTLQPGTDTAAAQPKACRIFVSYSHKDKNDALTFMKYLRLKLKALQLGIEPEQVYVERQKLLAGDEWDAGIQLALDEAEYFVFLVSVDSLSSEYCVKRELAFAVQRGIPVLPIILKPCPWDGQPIVGDPQNRKLGVFAAIPKDEAFDLIEISKWQGGVDDAWNTVVQQLGERLVRDKARAVVPASITQTTQPPPRVSSLLPYFCNQVPTLNEFDGQIRKWESSALLVLSRGLYDDNVPRFWERLRIKNLKDYLTVRNGQMLEPRPLVWPYDGSRRGGKEQLATNMLGAVSNALTRNAFQLQNATALSEWLVGLNGVQPLVTTLPRQKKAEQAAGIRTLLDLLEQCAALQAPLQKLVVAAFITDKELQSEGFGAALKPGNYPHTLVIDLAPLIEIDEQDIRSWHRDQEIESLCRVVEEDFVKQIFVEPQPASLRLGTFEERAKPILKY
ncbi:MAG TPA: toll/interleukin-1 receptor domain-containing protein [Steroidobacteraceae bacterium]|jgi:hypothetical protein